MEKIISIILLICIFIGIPVIAFMIVINISKAIRKKWLIISRVPITIEIQGIIYKISFNIIPRVFMVIFTTLLIIYPFYYGVALKSGICSTNFTKLSAEKMRERTIVSYLSNTLNWLIRMDDSFTLWDSRIAIFPRKITGSELIELISSSSVLSLLSNIEKDGSVIFIRNKKDLKNLDKRIFSSDFSIIKYSRDKRETIYVTTDEFVPVSEKIFLASRKKFSLTFLEKIRGYGNNFLTEKTYYINLEFPDNKKNKDSNIKHIMKRDSEGRGYFVVSNCGDILARDEGSGNNERITF